MAAAVDEEFSFSDLAPAAATAASSSSSFHHVQSPRVVQGCVATFLQLFEWYPGCKRISSASDHCGGWVAAADKLHRRRRSSCQSAVAHHGGFKEHCTDSLGAKLLLDDEEEEEDLNLWYTGAAAMSHKWSEKQNFARRRSTSTSTGLCVDDHKPNYCKKQVPGGVVARLMGLDSSPIKKAPGIPHLGETPHTDSEMLHGNLSSTLTKQSELTEKDLLLTGNQAPKQLLLDLEEEEEEAFGNRSTAKEAMMTTKATTHHLHHHHHQAGEKKQPSLFQLHYTGILKNRKGVFLTPESCLEADLDVKLLGPVLEPISGSFWGPVLEPKSLKKKSTPERNQTSLKGSRDDHSERIIQSERSQAIQFSGVTPHEEIQLKVKRRRRRKMPSSGYGLTDLTSNLKSSPSETSSLWEEESTFSSHDSATEEAHGESNLHKQKTHNNVFTNFELPQRSQSVYQVERTPVQSNHCSRFADEQCKHSSDLQQIRDDGIFSQVSNLQNEKSFTNMKKENETRSMEIIMDQKQQQQEGLSSRVKVDMKWDEASSECNKSELELNDGWGFKLVKSTQQLDYRTRREEKGSPLDGPSHQSPKSPLWSSGSDATAAETNKVIHGSCQLKPCGKHCSNKKQPRFNESSSSSSSAKSNQSEISSRVLDHGTTVNVMMKTKSCSDFKELLLLPGDHNFAGFNLTKTASDSGLSEFTSTATSVVARELFSDQSLKPNFAHLGKKKKCAQSHTKPRSINEVFPELPMEPETMTSSLNLSQRSYKGDNCMMRTTASENWPSTPGPQIPNNWIHETTSVFTDLAPAISGHCLPARSPLLQVDHDKDSSSSQAFQQDHSSLHRLFMSDSESSSSSFSPIESCSAWGSKVKSSSSPKKDEEVIIVECDHLDTKSSSTACSKSSPDSDEKFRMSVDDASWSEDAVTPVFENKKLLMDIETKVPGSMSMRLDKKEDNAKPLQASAAASVDECGQPSPVSILESPFLDESPTTTSEESISESEHSLDGILEDGCTESTEPSLLSSKQANPGVVDTRGSDVTTIDIESNRVGQSRLVEIPNFRNNSNNADITLNSSVDEEWEEEMKTYIREILNQGNNNNSNRNLVNKQKLVEGSDRIWQGDQRHLLFDSVNEMMMGVYCDVQYFSCSRLSELHYYFVPSSNTLELTNTGTEKLVIEIYGKIRESCNFATNAWQCLVDRDLMLHGSNRSWFQLNQEIAELGNDIEHMLFKVMIDELIYDLFSVSKNQWNPNLHLQQGAQLPLGVNF